MSRDTFLSKKEPPRKSVVIDGETLIARGLRGWERTKWERDSVKDPDGARGRLVVLATINEDGSAFFKPSDEKAVNEMPTAYIEPLVDAIFECSGMTPEAQKALGKDSATADGNAAPTS